MKLLITLAVLIAVPASALASNDDCSESVRRKVWRILKSPGYACLSSRIQLQEANCDTEIPGITSCTREAFTECMYGNGDWESIQFHVRTSQASAGESCGVTVYEVEN